jgi:hypothetical protein
MSACPRLAVRSALQLRGRQDRAHDSNTEAPRVSFGAPGGTARDQSCIHRAIQGVSTGCRS